METTSASFLMATNRCTEIVVKWHVLLDYSDLDKWFDSNRCCIPIALSRLLDKRILKEMST